MPSKSLYERDNKLEKTQALGFRIIFAIKASSVRAIILER